MFEFPHGARVLEIGAAEADWVAPMKTLRPDLHITCVDQRQAFRPLADVVLIGDVRRRDLFSPQTFDCIVSVSTIEHIGLGAYKDPLDPQGDTVTMANCRLWLASDGWMYFDVPYRTHDDPRKGEWTSYRPYTDHLLTTRLLQGWDVKERMVMETEHQDGPFIALTVTPA